MEIFYKTIQKTLVAAVLYTSTCTHLKFNRITGYHDWSFHGFS